MGSLLSGSKSSLFSSLEQHAEPKRNYIASYFQKEPRHSFFLPKRQREKRGGTPCNFVFLGAQLNAARRRLKTTIERNANNGRSITRPQKEREEEEEPTVGGLFFLAAEEFVSPSSFTR